MMLKDQVALITGASRGIGQAIAVAFAREGAKLVLSASSEANLRETEALLKQFPNVSYLMTGANVANGEEVQEVVKKALDTYGSIHILVNNAGITRDTLMPVMSEKDWDDVLSTNLKSVFLFTKACARPMMKQRTGSIINVSSVVGITGNAGQANYSASKAAMIAFTKSVAKELAKRNIRANAIAPGFIKTSMTDKLPEEIRKKVQDQIPLGRMGEPQEIAEVAVFLASHASRYMTAQVVVVDGGLIS